MSVQMDNIGALSYLEKMKGTQGKVFSTLSKEIWNYLLDEGILLTAEYLPGALNKEADFQSQTVDACWWKLNQALFQKIYCLGETQDI